MRLECCAQPWMHSEGPRGHMDMILGDRDNVSCAGILRMAEGQLSWLQLIPIRNGKIIIWGLRS